VILRLSHAELGVTDLAEARRFYVDVMGFLLGEERNDALYVRAADEFDRWSLKLTLGDVGLRGIGLRVAADADLDELALQHQDLGASVRELPAGAEPGLGRQLEVVSPDGFPVRFVHEVEEIALSTGADLRLPMRYTHERQGFPPSRLHHVNLRTTDVEASLRYWRDGLSFSVSEMVLDEDGGVRGAWMRRSQTTHDVAVGQWSEVGYHHVAFYVLDGATVLRIPDVLADGGYLSSLEYGPNRHGGTNALTVYAFDPFGNRLEFFTGDYVRDHDRPPIVWGYEAYLHSGRSSWGTVPPDSFMQRVVPVLTPGDVPA
jgi:catechol 2,3-dioxygenase